MIVWRVFLRIIRVIRFVGFFLWELIAANAVVAWEVVTPSTFMRPGIIAVPVRCRTEMEVTLLANLISLTPGTLTLEVSEDRSTLYVHGLHVKSPEHLRERVGLLENHLLEVLR
ncbi:MAG TPA: Na+/H+ antiporter subunit E [Actinomycetota bacterium]|nr:Na+/H+ antiporter subunit E [Actinomycetota bacterium]